MKVPGIQKAIDARKVLPDIFISEEKQKAKKSPLIWGKTFEGEEELHKMWDEDTLPKPPKQNLTPPLPNEDPYEGMTYREELTEGLGRTPARFIQEDERKFILGLTQPTSQGRGILESNVIALRKKYDVRRAG